MLGSFPTSTAIAGLLLRICVAYLRWTPIASRQRALLRFCRTVLLPRLPPFSDAVVRLRGRREVVMQCFQLGGEHHADIISEWLFFAGTWQPALTAYLQRTLEPGDTLVDVGANTGYFSLLGASLVGQSGSVVAIEACPRTYERLLTNLSLNLRLARRIWPMQVAAAEAEGEVTLYQHRREPLYNTTVPGAGAGGVAAAPDVWALLQGSGALGSLGAGAAGEVERLASDGVWRTRRVRSAPLDNLLHAEHARTARVLKVDVEGAEWAVLQGAAQLLAAGARLEIVVEVTPKWLALHKESVSVARLFEHMRRLGYHPYLLAAEDYELSRSLPPPPPPPPPRRIRADSLEPGCKQADIVFSRRDAEWLD